MKIFLMIVGLIASAAATQSLEGERSLSRAFDHVKIALPPANRVRQRGAPAPDDRTAPAEDLGNFHKIGADLYRSAQPSRQGYKQLKSMGIRTILTLRENVGRGREEAGAAGLAVESVPMSGFAAPSFEQVDRALAIMIDPAKRPLLVHCQHGKDRTGFVVASYRAIVEGMDDAKASEEAFSHGCCFGPFGDIKKFLKNYRRHRQALPKS